MGSSRIGRLDAYPCLIADSGRPPKIVIRTSIAAESDTPPGAAQVFGGFGRFGRFGSGCDISPVIPSITIGRPIIILRTIILLSIAARAVAVVVTEFAKSELLAARPALMHYISLSHFNSLSKLRSTAL